MGCGGGGGRCKGGTATRLHQCPPQLSVAIYRSALFQNNVTVRTGLVDVLLGCLLMLDVELPRCRITGRALNPWAACQMATRPNPAHPTPMSPGKFLTARTWLRRPWLWTAIEMVPWPVAAAMAGCRGGGDWGRGRRQRMRE